MIRYTIKRLVSPSSIYYRAYVREETAINELVAEEIDHDKWPTYASQARLDVAIAAAKEATAIRKSVERYLRKRGSIVFELEYSEELPF